MERYVWRNYIKKGMEEEYIRRHNEWFWPEMTELFNECGIHNYSIWLVENEVIGYMECEKGVKYALSCQQASKVKSRWDEYMKDILIRKTDPDTGKPYPIRQVFLHP